MYLVYGGLTSLGGLLVLVVGLIIGLDSWLIGVMAFVVMATLGLWLAYRAAVRSQNQGGLDRR